MDKAQKVWEEYARNDAFWAVSTYDKFRSDQMDETARSEFFATGYSHIEELWRMFDSRRGSKFRPAAALDYGCGVGRILLPLSERCDRVIGVDISRGMLQAARKNATENGRENIRLQTVDDFMSADDERYDLVHSYIVLQHMAPRIGYSVIRKLAERLNRGGMGMLHVTHRDPSPAHRRLRTIALRDVPGIYWLRSLLKGNNGPFIPMYDYDRDRVIRILGEHGCEVFERKETDHAYLGTMFYFEKR